MSKITVRDSEKVNINSQHNTDNSPVNQGSSGRFAAIIAIISVIAALITIYQFIYG